MYHPWRELRHLTSWLLQYASLPPGVRGECHWPRQTILLDRSLNQAERRSVLAHELQHVARGPFPRWATAREEEAVNVAAARRLIGVRDLGEALAWAANLHDAADELWVDVPTLEARLAHLHPAEVHYLRRRLQCDPANCAGCRHLHLCNRKD